ncbi:ABC transporter ATP-binding protein [Pleomorphomonas carboxyditropha]|uniref:Fe3+/spermidine/putrescine ABC transporter ATP-binding protein n=1 Tax=Pleomorphomonas carboxyditropha TaxID=2023338 RepID=A0A2G9WT89_9HYPH|nr:ABC transporter ATP-binding protein [Pleomorphomonas carboxyditropha]PIO97913.1 Fe3+/spermidine/putrescine ABC transporter ATP-binding protein [Pleomorphomonas carboxyditropha]
MLHDPSAAEAVSTSALKLHFGETVVLDGIDLTLARGRTLALLGPSGCGKTTLLRLIAGLLGPTRGRVAIAGRTVADAASGAFVPPEKRNLGMVFQDYALWPHMTVAGNVAFPLQMRGVPRAGRRQRTLQALDRVGLAGFADRRPGELSGGQQQRVAIARAIVAEPQLILFDEPLSNLDRELRETMVGELAALIAALALTAVYVTHDHAEALTLADEVAVMRGGRIVQLASPDRLVATPAAPEVADFLRLGGTAEVEPWDDRWRFAGSPVELPLRRPAGSGPARVLIPTAAVSLAGTGIAATVLRTQFRGDGHLAAVAPEGLAGVELQVLSQVRLKPGDSIRLSIDPDRIHVFPPAGRVS